MFSFELNIWQIVNEKCFNYFAIYKLMPPRNSFITVVLWNELSCAVAVAAEEKRGAQIDTR